MLINGEFVDDALVRIEAARLKDRVRSELPDHDELGIELRARDVAREMVIERTLLRQAARKDPAPIAPTEIEAEMNRYREEAPQQAGCLLARDQDALRANVETELRVRRLLDALTAQVPKPTNKEVSAFYRHAKSSLVLPETIHASHIVKNIDDTTAEGEALEAMRHIQMLLERGVPFEEVADEHSDCPGRGGDLGHFRRGEMVEEFDAAVFDLPVGAVSQIFRTQFGFHIVKVYERQPPRVPSLNEVRPKLEASIARQTKSEVFRAFMADLRARSEVGKSK